MSDEPYTSGWWAMRCLALEQRVGMLEAAIGLNQRAAYTLPPCGCICPPTSEQTCGAVLCPRRALEVKP
jgi:hypothetical protein